MKDSLWYWASAGKSLAGFTVGLAQEDGFLNIDEPSSNYLGQGWTDLPQEKEDLITIRHQISMTTGLDDQVPDNACTIDTCLQYKADAGDRWAYHNAPYTLVHKVIEEAVGKSVNLYILERIGSKTGMIGSYVHIDYDDIFFSTARSMARFGLLIINHGKWNQTQIMSDQDYFYDMVHSSKTINPSYGYLWWLNGQEKYMLPTLQIMFPGSLMPDAPAEIYCAEGKYGQIINVVPSQGLVIVRMGETPDGGGAISIDLNRKIWDKINNLTCQTNAVFDLNNAAIDIYPNPANGGYVFLKLENPDDLIEWKMLNASGIQLKNRQ